LETQRPELGSHGSPGFGFQVGAYEFGDRQCETFNMPTAKWDLVEGGERFDSAFPDSTQRIGTHYW
jgi:hypothetical protein